MTPIIYQPAASESSDRDELKAWLKANREVLAKYDPDELAMMARFCLPWVDRQIIYEILSHITDAKQGSNFDNRSQFHIWHETDVIERLRGKVDLMYKWKRLVDYQAGRDEVA